MLLSLRYRLLCGLLSLLVRFGVGERDLEAAVLRHQLKILGRGGARPRFTTADRGPKGRLFELVAATHRPVPWPSYRHASRHLTSDWSVGRSPRNAIPSGAFDLGRCEPGELDRLIFSIFPGGGRLRGTVTTLSPQGNRGRTGLFDRDSSYADSTRRRGEPCGRDRKVSVRLEVLRPLRHVCDAPPLRRMVTRPSDRMGDAAIKGSGRPAGGGTGDTPGR